MTTKKITDLGAGGIVTAEKFAVEIQKADGTTTVTPTRYECFDSAEYRAEKINEGIADGSYYWGWEQAYVVTADGTEV